MRERLPRYLIIAGSGALVIGVTLTVILVARRAHCSANPYNDNSTCLSYNPSIHGAFVLIVLGGLYSPLRRWQQRSGCNVESATTRATETKTI